MEIQDICDRLDKVKGVFLLSEEGTVYVLKGYDVKEGVWSKGWWPFKEDTPVKYISNISLSTGETTYEVYEPTRALVKAAEILRDRSRYVHMLKGLSQFGYTLKKK